MTPTRFNALKEQEKLCLLKERAVQLHTIHLKKDSLILYQLESFYIEARFNSEKHKIEKLNAFDDLALLDVFLNDMESNGSKSNVKDLNPAKRRTSIIKKMILGLAVPLLAVWIWVGSLENIVDEYLLITESKTTRGFITKVKEFNDVAKTAEGRLSRHAFYYLYDYKFNLPNGKIIWSKAITFDSFPVYHLNSSRQRSPIVVEYLLHVPAINRVRGMPGANKTVAEWFINNAFPAMAVFLSTFFLTMFFLNQKPGPRSKQLLFV